MQEELDAARTSKRSSFNEIGNIVSDDLHIYSRFGASSPIIGLILNNDSRQSNLNDSEEEDDDEDFEFEFPIFDPKLLPDAEQIQTVRSAANRSSGGSSSSACVNGSARGIRRWGVSFREMLNRREKSERKASWFVRLVSSKKTVAAEGEKRRGNNTSSYRIVGFGLFY